MELSHLEPLTADAIFSGLSSAIVQAIREKDPEAIKSIFKIISKYRPSKDPRKPSPEMVALNKLRASGYITKLYQVRDSLNRGRRRMYESTVPATINAHRVGDTLWIDYFEVQTKFKGAGTRAYLDFEKSLPNDIKQIRLVASDAGEGPSHAFWDKMGFDYAFPDDDNEMVKVLTEMSGYIPSESEKNDPRWKMALTKDVRPGTMKQSAKKFGWKIKRDGTPPTMR